jgi:hypothetical protein
MDATTLVLVEAHAGGKVGLGYTYGSSAVAALIRDLVAKTVTRIDAMAIPVAWQGMIRAVRNVGRPGIASWRSLKKSCCRDWAWIVKFSIPAAAGWPDRSASKRALRGVDQMR